MDTDIAMNQSEDPFSKALHFWREVSVQVHTCLGYLLTWTTKKKKAKNKALQGIQHGRKWGQDYIGGGKSPPDMLPFELGLKEGQEGAHPYLSEYTTNTVGPARRPGPCEENKKLRLWTKRGAFAVRDMRGSGSRWRPGILSALLPLQGATLRMCAQEVFNWMKG